MKRTTAKVLGKIDALVIELEQASENELNMANDAEQSLEKVFAPYSKAIDRATGIRNWLQAIADRVDSFLMDVLLRCQDAHKDILKERDKHIAESERAARIAGTIRKLTE
jgi:hypothetical protein